MISHEVPQGVAATIDLACRQLHKADSCVRSFSANVIPSGFHSGPSPNGAMPHERLDMQRTLDIITRLIAFDTTSDRSNLALIHFVRDLLAEHGIQASVLSNAEGDKASLLATIGPAVAGGVVLSSAIPIPCP